MRYKSKATTHQKLKWIQTAYSEATIIPEYDEELVPFSHLFCFYLIEGIGVSCCDWGQISEKGLHKQRKG